MLDDRQIGTLKENVSKNLSLLKEAMEWTQAKFAEKTGISEPALSNYLKGNKKEGRLPPLEYLVGLCTMPEFKEKGIELTLDRLIGERFQPRSVIQNRVQYPSEDRRAMRHSDFQGNYLCYFFEQSKTPRDRDYKSARELRYGVLSVFDACEGLTGEIEVRALSAFFKESEIEKALELKRALDAITEADVDRNSRNIGIEDAFRCKSISAYEGNVSFGEHHTFINVQSSACGDNALIILYAPQKKADEDYIGGIGCVASVTRDRTHMPTAQKIIISKYRLKCAKEVISEFLRMSAVTVEQKSEAAAICEFCRKLYSSEELAQHFDEQDKAAMLQRRLDQLVKNYVEKNLYCVGSVSEEEDRAVFQLIERSMD